MNSNILKIIGTAELSEPLEIDKDYLFSLNAGITNVSKSSDEQGGFVYTYKAKMRTCEVLKDNGQILRTKVGGKSKSKILYNVLWVLWDKSDKSLDFDEYYERELEKVIENYKKFLD